MRLVQRDKNFMNATITIKVVQKDESTVAINDAIENGFYEFDRIVKKFTRFNEDSELSNLNRMSGEFINVSEEFFSLIEFMLDLAEKTRGAFDPTIIDFLEVYGYDKNYDFSKLDNPSLDNLVRKIASERPSFKEIEIDKLNKRVKLMPKQKIDLGGIGKGYAIDCAFNRLIEKVENFIIDAGGDIRSKGKNEKEEYWRVGLKTQDKNNKEIIFGEVELKDEALACSGSWARKVRQFHHLIDPITGKPVEKKYRTVFVKAPTGIEADSWATALFINEKLKLPENYSILFS